MNLYSYPNKKPKNPQILEVIFSIWKLWHPQKITNQETILWQLFDVTGNKDHFQDQTLQMCRRRQRAQSGGTKVPSFCGDYNDS